MISSVEITRLRGIRQGKVEDLAPLTILVGPNGCGKSTVLDALLIGANPEPNKGLNEAIARHQGVPKPQRWFAWRSQTEEESAIGVCTHQGTQRSCALLYQGNSIEICDAKRHGASSITRAMHQLEGASELRLLDPRALTTSEPLHQVYSRVVERGRRDEAKAIIRAVKPDVRDIEILAEGDTPIVHLVYDEYSVPAAFAGDGVFALLHLCLELAARPNGVVLLEEPEVHQHPAALRLTARAILTAVSRKIQVVLSTHSLELIDLFVAEATDEQLRELALFRLQLADGELISHRIPGEEVAFSRTEIETDLR